MQSLGEASTSASMPHPRAVSQGQGPQSWGQWMYKMAEKGAKYAGVHASACHVQPELGGLKTVPCEN